ncbi:MAG: glutathione synthase [SAR86 cluster bacterium]|nr:glutathione synthase [SAR86 cluster bacterium]
MKLGMVMDPIGSIDFKKDSSLQILLEAQSRGHDIYYMEPSSLFLKDSGAFALAQSIFVKDNSEGWYELSETSEIKLSSLDMILMRQDPPFNTNYIYNTYVLEEAERNGVVVINKPSSLRDCNEKVFATQFPQCCTPFLVTSNYKLIKEFIETHLDTVIKPLDGMGGSSVFRVKRHDLNINVILETITNYSVTKVMVQKYIPDIKEGDKRILLVDGHPMQAAIARVPAEGEFRGNLAAGAKAVVKSLTAKDKWICDQVKPHLERLGLVLVGLDIIGEYLTEINITSPTCFKEYKNLCDIDVAYKLLDSLEKKLI